MHVARSGSNNDNEVFDGTQVRTNDSGDIGGRRMKIECALCNRLVWKVAYNGNLKKPVEFYRCGRCVRERRGK